MTSKFTWLWIGIFGLLTIGCESSRLQAPTTPKQPVVQPVQQPISGPQASFRPSIPKPLPKTVAYSVCYLIDRSGSMMGEFEEIKLELLRSIARMYKQQKFHLVLFSNDKPQEPDFRDHLPVKANDENKVIAAKFLDDVIAVGQTNPLPALRRAYDVMGGRHVRRPGRLIYLLSDGDFPSNAAVLKEVKRLHALQPKDKPIQICTFLYGERTTQAESVMKSIAQLTNGSYRYVARDQAEDHRPLRWGEPTTEAIEFNHPSIRDGAPLGDYHITAEADDRDTLLDKLKPQFILDDWTLLWIRRTPKTATTPESVAVEVAKIHRLPATVRPAKADKDWYRLAVLSLHTKPKPGDRHHPNYPTSPLGLKLPLETPKGNSDHGPGNYAIKLATSPKGHALYEIGIETDHGGSGRWETITPIYLLRHPPSPVHSSFANEWTLVGTGPEESSGRTGRQYHDTTNGPPTVQWLPGDQGAVRIWWEQTMCSCEGGEEPQGFGVKTLYRQAVLTGPWPAKPILSPRCMRGNKGDSLSKIAKHYASWETNFLPDVTKPYSDSEFHKDHHAKTLAKYAAITKGFIALNAHLGDKHGKLYNSCTLQIPPSHTITAR